MLKRPITFEDFDGNTVTETYYFNLSKSEIVTLQAGYTGGVEAFIERISRAGDTAALVEEFKKLILLAYGERSEDGRRFVKNDQLREEFTQMPAYDVLFMELATDADAAADFITGVIPRDVAKAIEEEERENAKKLTPPAPPAPQSPAEQA